MAGKNSLGNKAMGYTCDDLKFFWKKHQLYLFKNATIPQLMYMRDYLKKPHGLGIHITVMQLMGLSEK